MRFMRSKMLKQFKQSRQLKTLTEGFLSLVDQSLCSGTNFITAVLIGRACTKEEFGYYALGFALFVFLAGIQSSLLATPYTVLHPTRPPEERSYFEDVVQVQQLLFAFISTAILAVSAIATVTLIPVNGTVGNLLWILPIATAAMLTRDHLRRMCLGNLRMGTANILDLTILIIQLGGLFLLLGLGLLGAATAYVVIAVACIFPSIILIGLRFRSIHRAVPGIWHFAEDTWQIGRWKLGTHLSISAGTKAFPWFLAIFHGPAATAAYSACISLFFVANPFMMGMRNFLVPKLSQLAATSSAEVRSLVRSSTVFIGIVMGTGFVLVCIFGGSIVEWIYTDKYAGNGEVVCLLALATMTWSMTAPHTDGLLALRRPEIELKSYLLAAAIALTLGAFLVYRFGVVGAAFGLLISDGVAAVIRYSAFQTLRKHDEGQVQTGGNDL
jgi:O-antigen/teichoic acid export membrane protein